MTAPLATRVCEGRPRRDRGCGGGLEAGGLVAFPTETVYGLGADATNGEAVARLYEAKGRPAFNPLIAHVVDIAAARALARFDGDAARLAEAFWPGPLTLVLPKADGCSVAELATAGLDTIAVRVPAHAVAQKILACFGRPVVAPSANRSGHVSPTTAAHVLADLGRPHRSHRRRRRDAGRRRIDDRRLPRRADACCGPAACRARRSSMRSDGRSPMRPPGLRPSRRAARARHARFALRAAHAVAARCRAGRARRSSCSLRAETCRRRGQARACRTCPSAAI